MVEMKKYKLYEVSDYVTSKVSTSQLSLQDYVTTDCLLQNKCGRECAENLPPKSAKVTAYKPGDILISNIRPYLKKIWYANSEGGNSADVLTIRAKENFEKLYIYYMLFQDSFFDYVSKGVKGSKMPRGDKNHIMNFEILVPENLQVQKKIASTLSDFDKRIENLRAQNRVLEQTAKTIYDYTFLQCAGHQTTYNKTLNRNIPAGWEVKSVGDFAELITKGTTPTTLGFNFEENGVNFVKVECIENGRLITENLAHISKEAHEKLKRSNLHENDILVTIAGRLASPCVVPKSVLPANTNQAVGIIRLTKENQKYVQYVFYCIFDPAMQNKLKGINAQSIQKNLTLPNLGNIPIAVPDDKTLEEFNSQVIPIFRKQLVNSQQIETLTTQRNTLLPLLMTGQVEV